MGATRLLVIAAAAAAPAGAGYTGHLQHVICDVKRPLAQAEGHITTANYRAIIDGMSTNLHCNGVRVYIDPDISDPAAYPEVWRAFVSYARASGMSVYANPLGTGRFGKTDAGWVDWVANFTAHHEPDFLGPFNEAGMKASQYTSITKSVVSRVASVRAKGLARMVGPDMQHIESTIDLLKDSPGVAAAFDTVSSHNAVSDDGATPWAWWKLAQLAGGGVWATEDPRPWSLNNSGGVEVGTAAVVESAGPVTGLCIYLAYPHAVDDSGALTDKGAGIAAGIWL